MSGWVWRLLHCSFDLVTDTGMPHGKPAGVRCVQLTADNRCALYGKPERPAVCVRLQPHPDMCGTSADEAMRLLSALELATQPEK